MNIPFTSKIVWGGSPLRMIRGKNDKIDAQRIAVYASKNHDEVRLWVPKHHIIQKLDRLTALRNRLIKARKMMQTPLTDCKDFVSKKDLSETKKSLSKYAESTAQKDIKNVCQDLQDVIQNDPHLKELYELIGSVKGIGPTIATEILIITNERPTAAV